MANYYQPEIETMPYEQLRQLQSERLRRKWSLSMKTMAFNPFNGVICLLLVKEKDLLFKAVDQILVNQLDPPPHRNGAVLNLLVICVNAIIIAFLQRHTNSIRRVFEKA